MRCHHKALCQSYRIINPVSKAVEGDAVGKGYVVFIAHDILAAVARNIGIQVGAVYRLRIYNAADARLGAQVNLAVFPADGIGFITAVQKHAVVIPPGKQNIIQHDIFIFLSIEQFSGAFLICLQIAVKNRIQFIPVFIGQHIHAAVLKSHILHICRLPVGISLRIIRQAKIQKPSVLRHYVVAVSQGKHHRRGVFVEINPSGLFLAVFI